PLPAAELLSVLIERSAYHPKASLALPAPELRLVTGLPDNEFEELVSMLSRHDFIKRKQWFDDPHETLSVEDMPGLGWEFLRDVRAYCDKKTIAIRDLLVHLRFDLLD